MVMPRAFSSAQRSQSMPVSALGPGEVLPWSMWPAVPTITRSGGASRRPPAAGSRRRRRSRAGPEHLAGDPVDDAPSARGPKRSIIARITRPIAAGPERPSAATSSRRRRGSPPRSPAAAGTRRGSPPRAPPWRLLLAAAAPELLGRLVALLDALAHEGDQPGLVDLAAAPDALVLDLGEEHAQRRQPLLVAPPSTPS
jgi:hypothetical protein